LGDGAAAAGVGEDGGLPGEEAEAVAVAVVERCGGARQRLVSEGPEDITIDVVEEADEVGIAFASVQANDLSVPAVELGRERLGF
jgi:hypothetical protein